MDFRSENTIPWMLDTAARMEAEGHDLIRRAADLRDMAEEKAAELRKTAKAPATAGTQTDRCAACGQPVAHDRDRWRHILAGSCEWTGGPEQPPAPPMDIPGDPYAIPPNRIPPPTPADPAGETLRDQPEVTP